MRRRNKKRLSIILTAALILSIFNIPMFGYAAEDDPGTPTLQYGIFQYDDDENTVPVDSVKKLNLATMTGDNSDYYSDYYYVYNVEGQPFLNNDEFDPTITWESSDSEVAQCTQDEESKDCCEVTFKSRGNATITAKVDNEIAAHFEVKVAAIGIQYGGWSGDYPTREDVEDDWENTGDWSLSEDDPIELELGPFVGEDSDSHFTGVIRAHYRGETLDVEWEVEDPSIASYKNDKGYDYLEPHKEGTTKLTATQSETNDTFSVPIRVLKPVQGGTDSKAWFIKEDGGATLYAVDDNWNGVIPEEAMIDDIEYPVNGIRYVQSYECRTTTISIPNTVTDITGDAFYGLTKLKNINVSNDNENYCSTDGVLFKKNPKALYIYPAGRTNADYIIPDDTATISPYAFDNDIDTRYLRNIHVPQSVDFTGNEWIDFPTTEDEDYTITLCNIMGENTSVKEFAKEYGIPYKDISYLIAPKSVSTTLYRYNGMKLSWPSSEDADGYYVYCKRSTTSKWSYIAQTTGNSIYKANLASGAKYSFRVYPYIINNGQKCVSVYYKEGAGTYTLKTVDRPSISKSSSRYIKVKWSNISGESGYQIAKSKYKTKKYSVVKTVSDRYSSVKIKTKKKTTYYYKIRAYKTVGNSKIYGPWSSYRAYKLK